MRVSVIYLLAHTTWSADPPKLPRPTGDYLERPSKEATLEELKGQISKEKWSFLSQVDDPLKPDGWRFARQVKALLKKPWDPIAGKYLFIAWNLKKKGSNEAWEDLFWTSVENHDLGLLKFVVDEFVEDQDCRQIFASYLTRYRLSQLPNLDSKIAKDVDSLHSHYITRPLCGMLGVLFTDYPVNHPILTIPPLIESTYPVEYASLIMRLLFTHYPRNKIEAFRLPEDSSFQLLKVAHEICIEFGHEVSSFYDCATFKNSRKFKLVTKAPSGINLERYWEYFMGNKFFDPSVSFESSMQEVSFLEYLHDNWHEYFMKKVDQIPFVLLLGLAWKRCDLISLIEPKLIPRSDLCTPLSQGFTLEKKDFFKMLIEKYGFDEIKELAGCKRHPLVNLLTLSGKPNLRETIEGIPVHREDLHVWIKIFSSHFPLSDATLQAMHDLVSTPQYYREPGVGKILQIAIPTLNADDQTSLLDAWLQTLPTHSSVFHEAAISAASLLGYLFDHWQEHFKKYITLVPSLIGITLAWTRPNLSNWITLPDQMPLVFTIIPHQREISFEKTEYLQHLWQKYGDFIFEDMEFFGLYHGEVHALMHLIAKPDLDCHLAIKLMPTEPDESVYWISFLMSKCTIEPNEVRMLELEEAMKATEDRDAKLFCALFSQFKNLLPEKEKQ